MYTVCSVHACARIYRKCAVNVSIRELGHMAASSTEAVHGYSKQQN